MVKKLSYVEIKRVILKPEDRASNVPEDTKKVPLVMKVKGYLLHDANLLDEVQILTPTKRVETGVLIKEHPSYAHSFGAYVDVIHSIRQIILEETEDI